MIVSNKWELCTKYFKVNYLETLSLLHLALVAKKCICLRLKKLLKLSIFESPFFQSLTFTWNFLFLFNKKSIRITYHEILQTYYHRYVRCETEQSYTTENVIQTSLRIDCTPTFEVWNQLAKHPSQPHRFTICYHPDWWNLTYWTSEVEVLWLSLKQIVICF